MSYPGRDTAWCPRISSFKVHFSYALYCEAECFKESRVFRLWTNRRKTCLQPLAAIRLPTSLSSGYRGELCAPFCELNYNFLIDQELTFSNISFFLCSTFEYFDFFLLFTDSKLKVFFFSFYVSIKFLEIDRSRIPCREASRSLEGLALVDGGSRCLV